LPLANSVGAYKAAQGIFDGSIEEFWCSALAKMDWRHAHWGPFGWLLKKCFLPKADGFPHFPWPIKSMPPVPPFPWGPSSLIPLLIGPFPVSNI